MTVITSDNRYGVAQLIVAPTIAQGANYTTIASALAAAVSGQTIFLRPGTYTEDFTLKAGVNLAAFGSDGIASGQGNTVTANVIIKGTVTASFTGSVSLSGIQFLTNGAAAITNSGANVANVIFTNCSVNANDATGMTLSGSLTNWTFYSCCFNSASTNILFTAHGNIDFMGCIIVLNSSAGASTVSTGNVHFDACDMQAIRITTSSTGTITATACHWGFGGQTLLTTAGTGTSSILNCHLNSTTASAISIGAGTTVILTNTSIASSNANVLTGAGTLNFAFIAFTSSSSGHNVTTETALATLI